jgi:hypothetical protein
MINQFTDTIRQAAERKFALPAARIFTAARCAAQ